MQSLWRSIRIYSALVCRMWKSKKFWLELKERLQLNLNIELNINPSSIILGSSISRNFNTPINALYPTAKRYIFKASCRKEYLSVQSFIKSLKKFTRNRNMLQKLSSDRKSLGKYGKIFTFFLYLECVYKVILFFLWNLCA